MIRRGCGILFAIAVLLVAAAPPPNPAPPPNEDILVLGNRNLDQVRRDYVKAMALPSEDDQLARFLSPVCPFVAGLKDNYNDAIVERLRTVATAVGMRVAPKGCAPNALLYVVPDKKAVIDSWLRSNSEILGEEMSAGQARVLADSADPVVSWQILEMRGSDGRALARQRLKLPGGWDATNGVMVLPFALNSRLVNKTEFSFGASVIVVESAAVAGADIRQLADFAAMQLFAHTSPKKAGEQKAPTILTLVEDAAIGRPSPLSLTEWDFAYLKSLYHSTNMYKAGVHRGEIAKRMERYMADDQQHQ